MTRGKKEMTFKVIKENILKTNEDIASGIRLAMPKDTLMINIISSPGAGKTAFIEKIGPMLKKDGVSFLVITADCFTSKDAQRIDAVGVPVMQINTGNACHIDAQLIKKALSDVDIQKLDLIIVENVGNLVCPAEFDIGEDAKIAFLSTAEGADKPAKYPLLIRESEIVIINKMDLIEHTDFDINECRENIKQINPKLNIIEISCRNGENLDQFMGWIKERIVKRKEEKI